ncbi:cysteine peptidase family C39 domain-containing protein, partial [Vibrio metschnikovii]|uniref:cysteine peptidase family C39 domain-containing protein n=1 Tax=Vibrio metschnikovii TaxID=28172 RepID=UPI0027E5A66F
IHNKRFKRDNQRLAFLLCVGFGDYGVMRKVGSSVGCPLTGRYVLGGKMRRVVQQDRTGCGLACIAILAGTEYSNVKDRALDLFNLESSDEFYTNASELQKLGQEFNLNVGAKRRVFKGFNALPDLAILAINYRENEDTWHWVVYCRDEGNEFVIDPKKAVKAE